MASRVQRRVRLFLYAVALASGLAFQSPPQPPQPTVSLKGQLLVATSRIGDPRFKRTVILMAEHDSKGALGLIINKPARKIPLRELLQGMSLPAAEPDAPIQVHYGGPVQLDHVFLLHSTDVSLPSSRKVLEGVALSTDPEMLKLIARGEGPRHYLLLFGYAGWAARQLEGEMQLDSWITVPATAALIFSAEPEKMWERLMHKRRL